MGKSSGSNERPSDKNPKTKTLSIPPNWPSSITYLHSPIYAPSFPPFIRALLHSPSPSPSPNLTPAHAMIKTITDPAHPAFGQRGLFAGSTIPPRTFIIQYMGEIHVDERAESDYDLSLVKLQIPPSPPSSVSPTSPSPTSSPPPPAEPAYVSVGIDASHSGNAARFINDYRGVPNTIRPNAIFKDVHDAQGMLCMTIWTGKEGIKRGEEVLVSYGKGWWGARRDADASGD